MNWRNLPGTLENVIVANKFYHSSCCLCSPHVFNIRKDVHMAETIYGQQRQVLLRFAQVVKGMGKLLAIGEEKVYGS